MLVDTTDWREFTPDFLCLSSVESKCAEVFYMCMFFSYPRGIQFHIVLLIADLIIDILQCTLFFQRKLKKRYLTRES